MSKIAVIYWSGTGNTAIMANEIAAGIGTCLLYTSPSPRDGATSRMPSSA